MKKHGPTVPGVSSPWFAKSVKTRRAKKKLAKKSRKKNR